MKKAVFAGSFDPFTIGHEDIVKRGLQLFDNICIMIGSNQSKHGLFTIENRQKMIGKVFEAEPRVSVAVHDGLTVDFCRKHEIGFILRGLRNGIDAEYEHPIAVTNRQLNPGIDTVFLYTSPKYAHISSTIARDIIRHNGTFPQGTPSNINYSDFV